VRDWWEGAGSRALDASGLGVERNLHRYRRPEAGRALVRVDASVTDAELAYLAGIAEVTGVDVTPVAAPGAGRPDVAEVALDEVAARAPGNARLRWLSAEDPPVEALGERGVSLDRRPLAQAGHVEAPRWLLEQSVAVTAHRYGNPRAGPRPAVPGLGGALG
jgi:RHH-type transcriptional regulator, proline utilization regulon repressor / proline dehydrogenase / delta 1-pyrroline-5-carboxylate dehydrogenase